MSLSNIAMPEAKIIFYSGAIVMVTIAFRTWFVLVHVIAMGQRLKNLSLFSATKVNEKCPLVPKKLRY